MTPEEKAVIEAAERVVVTGGETHRLCEAVHKLRMSRQPQPRFYRSGEYIHDRKGNGGWAFKIGAENLVGRLLAALNDSEPA